jgi:hypothetical protein
MEVVNMDHRNCRRNALECRRLSEAASSPDAKAQFAEFAQTWLRMAGELESSRRLADLLNDIEQRAA